MFGRPNGARPGLMLALLATMLPALSLGHNTRKHVHMLSSGPACLVPPRPSPQVRPRTEFRTTIFTNHCRRRFPRRLYAGDTWDAEPGHLREVYPPARHVRTWEPLPNPGQGGGQARPADLSVEPVHICKGHTIRRLRIQHGEQLDHAGVDAPEVVKQWISERLPRQHPGMRATFVSCREREFTGARKQRPCLIGMACMYCCLVMLVFDKVFVK